MLRRLKLSPITRQRNLWGTVQSQIVKSEIHAKKGRRQVEETGQKMSRRRKKAEDRRGSVLDSLTTKPSGSVTTHGAKLMATPLGGTATVCTVTHYCRTSVFEFPGCHLISQEPVLHQVICESESFKAAVVSDLNDYFKQGHSAFSHFAIDVSLRDGVDRVYSREVRQNKAPKVPMFLVIEQHEKVPSTTFEDGECYLIDECRDGKAMIEGGREGERALLAFRTGNGAWPNFSPAKHAVNTVLVAVKVEQNLTHHIEERYSCSCFVSDDGRAVYAVHPTMSIGFGGVRVTSPVDPADLGEKVIRVRAIHDGLRRDSVSRPQVAELGPVNTNWPDYVTFQVWNLPKLNTNALRRICHYSAETSGFLTAKCSTPSCMSPNRDASGAGCRPGLETGTPSTPE